MTRRLICIVQEVRHCVEERQGRRRSIVCNGESGITRKGLVELEERTFCGFMGAYSVTSQPTHVDHYRSNINL